jgi:tetratricopeptide (TPR) repeat protein
LGACQRAQESAWAYYCLALVPMLGLFQNGPQLAADRFSYLSCLGWALLVGAAAAKASAARPLLVAVLVAAASLLLAGLSFKRSRDWRDDDALWQSAVRSQPASAVVRLNYGLALAGKRRLFEALDQFEQAALLEPDNAWAWTDQGYALLQLRRFAQAEEALRRALTLENLSAARTYLGAALLEQDRPEEAAAQFRRVVELEPRSQQARDNLEAALAALAASRRKK